jgi:hypothetical protein
MILEEIGKYNGWIYYMYGDVIRFRPDDRTQLHTAYYCKREQFKDTKPGKALGFI